MTSRDITMPDGRVLTVEAEWEPEEWYSDSGRSGLLCSACWLIVGVTNPDGTAADVDDGDMEYLDEAFAEVMEE